MPEQELSPRDLQRLVDAFLELDTMRSRDVRDLALRLLDREVGEQLYLRRHDEARVDMSLIIEGCLQYPGALHSLVEIVGNFHRGSLPMSRLQQLADQLLSRPLLSHRERSRLYEIAAKVRVEGLAKLYRAAVAPFGPRLRESPDDVVAVIHTLEEVMAAPDEIPPLLRFLELLAGRVADPIAVDLRQLVEEIATRVHPSGDFQRFRRSMPETGLAGRQRGYLVIQLQEDGVDPDRYQVSVWWQEGDQGLSEVLHRDDDAHALHEIPGQIDELLAAVPDLVSAADGGFILEFILPRHLLSHAVDQWDTAVKMGFPRPLGTDYPVVVRSLDRMKHRLMHYEWRRKWQWFRENGHIVDASAVHWVKRAGQSSPRALFSRLKRDEKPVCLVLPFEPTVERSLGRDELAAGLHAGVPVMLWCRDGFPAQQFEDEIRRLLEGQNLHELPDSIMRLRLDAEQHRESGDHLGMHLTLLWDDPNRMPEPYVPLKAPV